MHKRSFMKGHSCSSSQRNLYWIIWRLVVLHAQPLYSIEYMKIYTKIMKMVDSEYAEMYIFLKLPKKCFSRHLTFPNWHSWHFHHRKCLMWSSCVLGGWQLTGRWTWTDEQTLTSRTLFQTFFSRLAMEPGGQRRNKMYQIFSHSDTSHPVSWITSLHTQGGTAHTATRGRATNGMVVNLYAPVFLVIKSQKEILIWKGGQRYLNHCKKVIINIYFPQKSGLQCLQYFFQKFF